MMVLQHRTMSWSGGHFVDLVEPPRSRTATEINPRDPTHRLPGAC